MYLISICGGSGSGKTTFTKKIIRDLDDSVATLHMDSYYLPKLPRDLNGNYDHPNAFDWVLLKKHLRDLKHGKRIKCPIYDFKTSKRIKKTITISPTKVVLFEGIFSLYDEEIRNLSDIMTFLHVDADIRFIRRLHRDVEERGRSLDSVISQYYESVRPMYEKFLTPQRQFADLIVGEETDIAANILSAKINELITKAKSSGK